MCVEDIEVSPSRGLDKAMVRHLGTGAWIREHVNVLLTRNDGSVVQVRMTYGAGDTAHCRGATDTFATAFELPYKDDAVSMLILLPADAKGLAAFEAQLTKAEIDSLVSKVADTVSGIMMPKWTMHFTLPLVPALKAVGITDAFDQTVADLSGIPPTHIRWLSEAWHQAYVAVDEEGTTAAAATAVGAVDESAPPTLYVDHPFLYLIRDRLTGSILFVGRVADPSQSSSAFRIGGADPLRRRYRHQRGYPLGPSGLPSRRRCPDRSRRRLRRLDGSD